MIMALMFKKIDDIGEHYKNAEGKRYEEWLLIKRHLMLGILNHVLGFPYQADGSVIVLW